MADDPRVTVRRHGPPDPDGRVVVCWIQRAQRADDNPALDVAIDRANALGLPVVALFVLRHPFGTATRRQDRFMLEGLAELPAALARRRVACAWQEGGQSAVVRFCSQVQAALLVSDENPLREAEAWRAAVAARLRVPFWTVDADVVVPSALLEKEQFSAGTIRPRLQRQLEWCLRPPARTKARHVWAGQAARAASIPEASLLDRLSLGDRLPPVTGLVGGTTAARGALRRFVHDRLAGYSRLRNRPEVDATSQLSPYLHFGQIGPREVALAVRDAAAPAEDRQAFLDEFIVRRELAWNFVRFNPRYDRLDGCEPWALRTLAAHRDDERRPTYSLRQLADAETHDPLWNAAQRQMMASGWMHGYVRMYWAKKILQWAPSPEDAMAAAIELNDRYELNGRDPNGYAGIAWAIGGKHDRAWGPERPVFGTIRYMSFASTSRKFNSREYIRRWTQGGAP